MKKILSKLKLKDFIGFFIWPLVLFVTFFFVYNRFVTLYFEDVENRGTTAACDIVDSFRPYLDQIDDTLKTASATVEYMMSNGTSDEEILQYITYETEKLGIVSATGSRGIFGVFGGTFMDGVEWNPHPGYDPTKRPWYQVAVKNKGEYGFAGPYFNNRTNENVVTACKLLDDGVSVIAFAIDFDTFERMTTDLVEYDKNRSILIMSEDGHIYSHSNDFEIGDDYAQSDDPFIKALFDGFTASKNSTFTINKGNGVKDNYIVSYRRIMYDMYVVTVTNLDEELSKLNLIVGLFALSFIIVFVVMFILNLTALSKELKFKESVDNLRSLANIYVAMHKIDLEDDSFSAILCMDYKVSQLVSEAGKKASEMLSHAIEGIVDERSKEDMLKFVDLSTIRERLKTKDTITEEFLNYEHIWNRARFVVVDRDKNSVPVYVIFASEIIDDEKRARDRFKYLAETDQLTGINNRGSGEAKIRDLLMRNVGGMFILFDADKFKYVNDNFGHDVGDEVLIGIAEKMLHTFREKDVIMRLGGDEFAAYIPGVFHEEEGRQILYRLMSAIYDMKIPKMENHKISISIGAAFYFSTDSFSFEELYSRADSCTYESKKITGSAVTFYHRKDEEVHE